MTSLPSCSQGKIQGVNTVPQLLFDDKNQTIKHNVSQRLLRDLSATPEEYNEARVPILQIDETTYTLPVQLPKNSVKQFFIWINGALVTRRGSTPHVYLIQPRNTDSIIHTTDEEICFRNNTTGCQVTLGDDTPNLTNMNIFSLTGKGPGENLRCEKRFFDSEIIRTKPYHLERQPLFEQWLGGGILPENTINRFWELFNRGQSYPSKQEAAIDCFRKQNIMELVRDITLKDWFIYKKKFTKQFVPLNEPPFSVCKGCGEIAVHHEKVEYTRKTETTMITMEVETGSYYVCEHCRTGGIPDDKYEEFISDYGKYFDMDTDETTSNLHERIASSSVSMPEKSNIDLPAETKREIYR